MKRISCLLLLVIGIYSIVFAENENEMMSGSAIGSQSSGFSISKINVGGNIGGGFANDVFFLNIQPRISYQLNKWIVPGISMMYQYSSEKYAGDKFQYNTWGAGVFANIYPVKNVYAHAEYQHLWYKEKIKNSSRPAYKSDDSFLLLGAGVAIPMGSNFYMNASILFNVLEDINGIYENPIYSVGFGVNL